MASRGSKWAHGQRRNARHKLDRLLKRQGFRCHWCHREIVRLSVVARNHQIFKQTSKAVTFRLDGVKTTKLIATIDHLEPLANKPEKPNAINNLVAACHNCNGNRANEQNRNAQSKLRRELEQT